MINPVQRQTKKSLDETSTTEPPRWEAHNRQSLRGTFAIFFCRRWDLSENPHEKKVQNPGGKRMKKKRRARVLQRGLLSSPRLPALRSRRRARAAAALPQLSCGSSSATNVAVHRRLGHFGFCRTPPQPLGPLFAVVTRNTETCLEISSSRKVQRCCHRGRGPAAGGPEPARASSRVGPDLLDPRCCSGRSPPRFRSRFLLMIHQPPAMSVPGCPSHHRP